MGDKVQAALEARKTKKEKQLQDKQNQITSALEARKKRLERDKESNLTDFYKRLNAEIEAAKKFDTSSYTSVSLADALNNTRNSRVALEGLRRDADAYRSYLGDEDTNTILSTIDEMYNAYDYYLWSTKYNESGSTLDYDTYKALKNQSKEKQDAALGSKATNEKEASFWDDLDYFGDSVINGLVRAIEGGVDFVVGGVADIFGYDEYAEELMANDWYDYGAAAEEYRRAGGNTESGFWATMGDIGGAIGSTVPNLAVAVATGGSSLPVTLSATAGTALVTSGGIAASDAYKETGELGSDEWEYGMYSGIKEAALEIGTGFVGKGVTRAGRALGSTLFKETGEQVAKAAVKKGFAKTLAGDMLSEAFEEGASEFIDPYLKRATYDPDAENAALKDIAYAAFLGAVSGGITTSATTGIGKGVSNYKAKKVYGDGKALVGEGLEIGGDVAKLAEKYQASRLDKGKGLTGGQIISLNEAIRSNDVSKIKSTIEQKLTEYGETGDVSQIAEVLVKRATGEKFTSKDVRTLNESKAGYLVEAELNPENIESGALKNNWAENIGTRRVNPKAYNKELYTQATEALKARQAAETASVKKSLSDLEKSIVDEAKVSESGKPIYTKDGKSEEVSIKRVASVKGGLMLETEDGRTVSAKDISFGTTEEAVMYEMVAKMDVTPETANEFIRTFKPTNAKQAALYFSNVALAYQYGKINYEAGLKNISLSKEQKRIAFNRGRIDAKLNVKANPKANAKGKAKTSEGKSTEEKGIIYEDGFVYDESTASEIQKVSMAHIEVINKLSNLEVHVFESKVVDGKRVATVNGKLVKAPNGYFKNGNQIYVDINAGNGGEGAMLYTMSHEIGHYIRRWNEAGFKELADFLIEQYGKNGVDVNERIEAQKEKIRKRYEEEGTALPDDAKLFDMAYEELVADAMSDMLTDPKAYEKLIKLKEKNRTLWEKVGEAINAVLDKFKAALGIYKTKDVPVAREAFEVRGFSIEAYEKLQNLYIKAFVEADANYNASEQTLEDNGIMLDSSTDSATIMSVRDVLDDTQRKKVSQALATRFGVTESEAVQWLTAETSLASLILNPKYSQYLDYTPDPNEVAIKQNSDYPQGTVDFSPICAKRREFTSVMNNVLRQFPNHVFAATDLAKIRTIMQEEGMTIPCGICYVEDRRQLDTIVAQNFIDSLKLYREGSKTRPDGKAFNTNQLNGLKLTDGDSYTPSVYDLVSLEGLTELKKKNPKMAEAWVKFNNARGMQSVRLLANEAEYKRQILKYSKSTVKSKNDKGGLRVYSFSDAEMFHLIDIIQVITDSATVGLSLQGYTKVNEYARAVKDTGEKLNRSLIPKGELGYHVEDGKVILDYDTVEGIDINHPDFFDNKDNPNVGNITIGINDIQIRAAMVSDFVDQIIPFHTGQSEEVLGEKGISTWDNYKDFQTEKDIATGKVSEHQINIYTEVLQVLEKEGKPITKKTFVEKFLQACRENNLTPRFSQFLNINEKGEYAYTEGYHKFLVDFKTFDQTTGKYLPQMPVKPIFENGYITQILKDYVKTQKVKDAEIAKSMPRVIERITNEIIKPREMMLSDRDSEGNTLSEEQQEYFKDSKVRDKKGNLMVLYHGTTANFNTFKKGDVGFHFGTKGAARGRVGFGKNVTLKEVYLNITNPIVFDEDLGSWDADFRLTRELYDRGILTQADAESVLFTDDRQYKRTTEAANKKLASVLIEKGYDGIAYQNTFETKKASTSYIVFNSNQVKEITNKTPTSDPDIRYSDRDFSKDFTSDTLNSFNIEKLDDSVHIQRRVLSTLLKEGFFTNAEDRSRTDVNEESGMVIVTNKKGIFETFGFKNFIRLGKFKKLAKLATIRSLPDIIKHGHLVADNVDNQYDITDPNKKFAYIEYATELDGKDIIVKLAIKKSPQKNKFWVHSIYTIENVSDFSASTENGTEADYRTADDKIIPQDTEFVNRKFSDREIQPVTEAEYETLKKHFGVTGNFRVAGYLLTDGKLLDFSGKHWGDSTSRSRQVDHRDVQEVLGRGNNGIDDMVDMIGSGNIRLMPEIGGINLAVYPNEKQRRVLSIYIKQMLATEGQVIIDYDTVGGDTVHSRVYEKYSSSSQILSDIRNYFNGARRSDLMDFHTSLSDRDTDSVSNRTILANALESVAENDIERNKLTQYKQKIALIESEQAKLTEIRAKANELRFTKGRTPDETKTMRSLDFEANQIASRISTYDKQLLNLESTKALKNVLDREKTMLRKRLEQKGKDAVKKQKEKDAETIREIMTRNTESRKKAVEGRHKTEMRHKIKDIVSDLNKLLLNPTKDQHVPIGLQGVVAEALDAINMDTMNAEERVAYYNSLIAKAKDPDEIAMLTKKRDFFEYRDMSFKDKITALKNAYAEFKESDDPLIRNAHNDAIEELIKNTADAVGNKSLKDMSLMQLEAVYDMYKAIRATVRNSNKMFKEGRQETITDASELVKSEVREIGGHKDRVRKVTKWLKTQGWNMLKPVYAVKMIGSKALESLYDNVRAGEDTWAVDVSEAKEFYGDKAKKYNYKSWDFKAQHSFKDSAGNDFSLSLEQIMSLYAYSKREQADKHLEVGGFVFDDVIEVTEKNKIGIPVKYEVNDANPYRLRKEDLGTVIATLTEEQKRFIDEMQTYLSDVMGAKGNEVSLALYDIKLYKENNYFPLKTARYFREFDPEKNGTPKIKNSGFSKKTVPQAGNPIVLSNFMDVWAKHVNDMSMYHAFVLPLEDFMRVYNYSSTAGGYDSVQQAIKNAYGTGANQYIETLMDDLNGGARVDPTAGVINKMIGLSKKAAVLASASVVIQQPSALFRSMAYINPKYFVGTPKMTKHKDTWAEVKKYAPVALIKEMGYFDTGMGQSTVEWIKGDKSIREKADDVLSKAPALADEMTWCAIWKAVKRETLGKNKNLAPNSEEFLKKCGERFTEVVTETQVYDSVLARSGMMRSKDTGMKMATAFMAEPTTSFNMTVNAIMQGKRGNKKFTAGAFGAIAASIIVNSALVSLVYAARDDDEDETYIEKYLGSVTTELIDGFNPLTYIPFIKDIWSIFQGYDVERSDMSLISDLWQSFEKLFGEGTPYEKVSGVSGALASVFGVPLKNILRDAEGTYNFFKTVTSGTPTTGAGIMHSISESAKDAIPLWGRLSEKESTTDRLYDAIMSGDTDQIKRMKSKYDSQQKLDSAMKTALRENDPRIKEAAEARYDGDISEYKRIAKEIIAEGNFSQDIVVGAINAEINAIKKGETSESEQTEEKDEATSIYKSSDVNAAFESGDNSLALEIIEDLVKTKVANGMEEKNAKSSVRSSMTSYWKPLYVQAYQSRDSAELERIRRILYASGLYGNGNEVVKTVQNWLKD